MPETPRVTPDNEGQAEGLHRAARHADDCSSSPSGSRGTLGSVSQFEVIIGMPTFGTDDYFTLIRALADPEQPPTPYLVAEDKHGGFERVDLPEGRPFPHRSILGIRIAVEADDPLQAATDLTASLAETLDSLGMRAHYPTIRDLSPLPWS